MLTPEESVQERIERFFQKIYGNLTQPTVQTLLKIASDLDQERGYGSELALPISVDEILTAIFEFNESGETYLDNNSVLVTSCHGAKGLEFSKVILLTDGFKTNYQSNESERRLFYVAMTRAKEELLLSSTAYNSFIQEASVISQKLTFTETNLPSIMHYFDFTPADIYLSYQSTRNNRSLIESLQEGTTLELKTNRYGNGWVILTQQGIEIGSLSKKGNQTLLDKQIIPGSFEFLLNEVTVKYVYHHLKLDEVTDQILEDWFVVIPQIRICR